MPYVWRNNHKNKQNLCFVTHIFIKLSQNVCCEIHKFLYRLCYILRVFTIDDYSCLKFSIFTELSQYVCLINIHSLLCRYARSDCRLWKVIWFLCVCFRLFKCYYMFETLYLHQTFTNWVLRQKCSDEKLNFDILSVLFSYFHQIFTDHVFDQYTFCYADMPDVTADFEKWNASNCT